MVVRRLERPQTKTAIVRVAARKMVMQSSRFRRICVFCGSSQGKKMRYHDAAIDLSKELVRTTKCVSIYRDHIYIYYLASYCMVSLLAMVCHSFRPYLVAYLFMLIHMC